MLGREMMGMQDSHYLEIRRLELQEWLLISVFSPPPSCTFSIISSVVRVYLYVSELHTCDVPSEKFGRGVQQ